MLWDKYPQVGTLEMYARLGPNITSQSSCADRMHNAWTKDVFVPHAG